MRSRATSPASPRTRSAISPKHDGGLLGAGELAWDATHGVPLRFAIYARAAHTPVLELKATDISFGSVASLGLRRVAADGHQGRQRVGSRGHGGRTAQDSRRPARQRGTHKQARGERRGRRRLPPALHARGAGHARRPARGSRCGCSTGAAARPRSSPTARTWAASRSSSRPAGLGHGAEPAPAGRSPRPEPADGLDQRRHRAGARHGARDGRALHPRRRRLHGARFGAAGGGGRSGTGAVTDGAERSRRRPIEVRGLVKRYGELRAVDGVDLTINERRRLRLPRPQRSGQDDVAADDARADHADGRNRAAVRPRPASRPSHALDGVAGFVEAPTFYPYLNGRRNLELLAAYDGGGAARADRRGAGDRRARRPRQGSRRRLLARHAPAARHRRARCCASPSCCCSTSRPPAWTRPACATCGC